MEDVCLETFTVSTGTPVLGADVGYIYRLQGVDYIELYSESCTYLHVPAALWSTPQRPQFRHHALETAQQLQRPPKTPNRLSSRSSSCAACSRGSCVQLRCCRFWSVVSQWWPSGPCLFFPSYARLQPCSLVRLCSTSERTS